MIEKGDRQTDKQTERYKIEERSEIKQDQHKNEEEQHQKDEKSKTKGIQLKWWCKEKAREREMNDHGRDEERKTEIDWKRKDWMERE